MKKIYKYETFQSLVTLQFETNMENLTIFALLIAVVYGQNNEEVTAKLQQIISQADCNQLSTIGKKLESQQAALHVVTSNQTLFLSQLTRSRENALSCPSNHNRRKREECLSTSVGDGWCDVACNIKDTEWDGGDCCPHTCTGERVFPCGSGGYQCKGAKKIPVWFAARTSLCFKWYADGNGGQCGGGVSTHLCAKVNEMTTPYRDDTDQRPGGCRMMWGLETTELNVPGWAREMAICFRWFADGDGGQCGAGAPKETCAKLGEYTQVYRDDTDGRPGGCQMSWRVSLPQNADYWAQDIALCYQWEADGDAGQCGGGADRRLCATAGAWTPYYRDDTDHRGGGCRMQWGLVMT